MVPVFPLGVKKDTTETACLPGHPDGRHFDPEGTLRALGASDASADLASPSGFPTHIDPEDISFKLAGCGR